MEDLEYHDLGQIFIDLINQDVAVPPASFATGAAPEIWKSFHRIPLGVLCGEGIDVLSQETVPGVSSYSPPMLGVVLPDFMQRLGSGEGNNNF